MNQSEAGIFPKFVNRPVEMKAKSREAGRPIFEEREFVEITIAGDSKTMVSHKVTDEHRNRWPQHYEAFKRGLEAPLEGTPLSEWPSLSASRAAELKALNIHTVESLAALNDGLIQRIGMGGRELVQKAKAFIESAKDSAAIEKYAAENQQLRNDIEMLKAQVKELAEASAKDAADAEKYRNRKKPGPKPKAEE